jgi:colanic acid/amylovoran biosynthesis protein
MRILILWGDDMSANLGVRVLAEGTAALVRRVWPDAVIQFQNYGHRNPHLPLGRLRSMLRERVSGARGMQDWLSSFDLVVDTRSGDSLADIYGLDRLRVMSLVSEFATQAGTPVVVGPQTIGPFTTRQGRLIGRRSLRRAALTMARDSASRDYAASIRRPVDVLTTDVVFALPVPSVERTRDVILNVSGLLWRDGPHLDSSTYRRIVSELYGRLSAGGRSVSLLAHVIDSPSADNDVPALHELAKSLNGDPEILIPSGLDDARSMVASAQLVIGSRMHACLNALSVGTPALPLAYSRKFEPLLLDLGWRHTVDLRTSDDPVGAAMRSVDDIASDSDVHGVRATATQLLTRAEDSLRALL